MAAASRSRVILLAVTSQPNAFDDLPTVRSQTAELRNLLVRRKSSADVSALLELAQQILGVPLELSDHSIKEPDALSNTENDPPAVAALIADIETENAKAILQLDPILTACALDRVLGGRAENIPSVALSPLGETEKGVLAFLLSSLLTEATDGRWSLQGFVTSNELLSKLLQHEPTIGKSFVARLADRKGRGCLWLPKSCLEVLSTATAGDAVDTDAIEVDVIAEIGRTKLSATDYATLQVGDAITVDERFFEGKSVDRARIRRDNSDGWTMQCAISDEGLVALSIDHGTGMGVETTEGRVMDDQTKGTPLVSNMSEAQIELSIEVARFRMSLAELSATSVGQVLLSGAKIGEKVVLRAGERAVANGELINVEGELAIRLTELARS